MDIKILIAIVSSLIAVLLAFLNFRLNREINKTNRLAERKTQSYIDFINAVSETSVYGAKDSKNRPKELTQKLLDAKTRITIYGDSEVIIQLAEFHKNHGVINSPESRDSYMLVVEKRRAAATGRSASGLKNEIRQILIGDQT